jgi:quaternary ammonium compound-resistance protein SugE
MMAKMAQGPSPAALTVRRLAESERVRLGHPYLGDEHLLLGVLAHASNRAAAMLTERGLDLTTARAGIARLVEEAGPIARDDATVLREFGIDVAQMRRQLESTFGVLAVHEAERHVRLRPRWRGCGGHSPLCGPPYLIKRAQFIACTTAGKRGDKQIRPEHLLYGVLRVARDPLGSGLGRRGRGEMARLGLRAGVPHPVRLLLAEHGIDLDQLSEVCSPATRPEAPPRRGLRSLLLRQRPSPTPPRRCSAGAAARLTKSLTWCGWAAIPKSQCAWRARTTCTCRPAAERMRAARHRRLECAISCARRGSWSSDGAGTATGSSARRYAGWAGTCPDFAARGRPACPGADSWAILTAVEADVEEDVVMAWFLLVVAGIFETGFAVFLKQSHGITRFAPSVGFAICALISFGLLTVALRSLEVGPAYAAWTGIGAAGTAAIGMLVLGDEVTAVKLASIALILLGVIGLNLSGVTP